MAKLLDMPRVNFFLLQFNDTQFNVLKTKPTYTNKPIFLYQAPNNEKSVANFFYLKKMKRFCKVYVTTEEEQWTKLCFSWNFPAHKTPQSEKKINESEFEFDRQLSLGDDKSAHTRRRCRLQT